MLGTALWFGVPWSDALTAIGTTFLGLFGITAVVGYFMSWRSLVEGANARQTQVYKDIALRWDHDDLVEIRAKVGAMSPIEFHTYYRALEKSNSLKDLIEIERLANYFEDLGVLESRQSIDIQWIEESLGGAVCKYWKLWELVTVEDRGENIASVTDQGDLLYRNWELLARRVQIQRERRQFHHPDVRHRRKHF